MMRSSLSKCAALALLGTFAGALPASAGLQVTGIGRNGRLYLMDAATGTVTTIADTHLTATANLAESADGQLYTTSGNGVIFRIDPATGAATLFSAPPIEVSDVRGLGFTASGDLLATDHHNGHSNRIFTIAPSGSWSLLATSNEGELQGLAFSPDATLYSLSSDITGAFAGLQTIDPVTGSGTDVTSAQLTNSSVRGLSYAEDGSLYTMIGLATLIAVDPTTGLGTTVRTFDLGNTGETVLGLVAHFTPDDAPVAVAGPDQTLHAGATAHLDGSGSHDDSTATADLSYQWSIDGAPTGSTAALVGAGTETPSLATDAIGRWAIGLVVVDGNGNTSAKSTTTITATNQAPVAAAHASCTDVLAGTRIDLDGRASADPDGDALTLAWTLSRPAGSHATLTGAATASPRFTTDVPGDYAATLTVTDRWGATSRASVTVEADSLLEWLLEIALGEHGH